ncbi:MAG: hypothetical protein HRT69_03600 [Flavobacteriaceae bacterium]|nr:hypothetical protein [Flavobacteriaceae bacterium]
MYYYIEDNYKKGDVVIKGMNDSENIVNSLIKGDFTEIENIIIETSPKNGKKSDFLMTEGVILPFVSNKVKMIIEEYCPEKIQFISTNLEGYFLLHTVEHISCFDWGSSKFTKHPPFLKELSHIPQTVEKLVFDENKIERDIFRMLEEPITLFISEKLKKIFQENNVSGIEYGKLEKYRKGMFS